MTKSTYFPMWKWKLVECVITNPDISAGAARLYVCLMSHHNTKTGRTFPGQARLAKLMGCSVRTIGTYLRELREKELIFAKKRKVGGPLYYQFKRSACSQLPHISENSRQTQRKEASDQPMNKPMNLIFTARTRFEHLQKDSQKSKPRSWNKTREMLERAVCGQFQGTKGYEYLIKLEDDDPQVLNNAIHEIQTGEALNEVATLLIETLHQRYS